jgi:acetyl/propionyl-CoA carboxylase alpha subunit
MFESVLIPNRGEIARRVIRTLRRLGIRAVAVYSDADRDAPFVREADEALRIGPAPALESYLSIERILDAAERAGAQAVHPGYGFLSERAEFARACARANLTFVGPPPEAMETMGDKLRAKETARAAGVPVVPMYTLDEARTTADYPLLVKAAAGGGGRGMRVVGSPWSSTRRSPLHGARPARASATIASSSSASCRAPATSRSRSSPTPTDTWSTSASANARSSGAIRRCSRRPRRRS